MSSLRQADQKQKQEQWQRPEWSSDGFSDEGMYDSGWDLWEEWMGWEGAGIRDYSSHINPYIWSATKPIFASRWLLENNVCKIVSSIRNWMGVYDFWAVATFLFFVGTVVIVPSNFWQWNVWSFPSNFWQWHVCVNGVLSRFESSSESTWFWMWSLLPKLN